MSAIAPSKIQLHGCPWGIPKISQSLQLLTFRFHFRMLMPSTSGGATGRQKRTFVTAITAGA
jgi:hypothetical protein